MAKSKGVKSELEDQVSVDSDAEWVDRIQRKLIDWYQAFGRAELPWRRDRNPYRVLVSEMMLIQTTVATVTPYFDRFIAQFPSLESLANASEADVLKAWEGLGYYRRARQLQAAARAIVESHSGNVPSDPVELQNLPGVGRYIAGAILSIAFNRPEPILEANTERVLTRLIAWRSEIKETRSQQRLWEVAARLVPKTDPGQFNQAMMDFGATLCVPKEPRCLQCPISSDCQARGKNLQDILPIKAVKQAPLEVKEACIVLKREDGRLLLHRRGEGGLWSGFYEFPTLHLEGPDPAGRGTPSGTSIVGRFETLCQAEVELGAVIATIKYTVTKHRVTLKAYGGLFRGPLRNGSGDNSLGEWVDGSTFEGLPRTSPTRKLGPSVLKQDTPKGDPPR